MSLEPPAASDAEQLRRRSHMGQTGAGCAAANGYAMAIMPPLTPREVDVLHALARGLQNKEIAQHLALSERTVKYYVSSLFRKLGAGNRTEAVTLAMQRHLIEPPM